MNNNNNQQLSNKVNGDLKSNINNNKYNNLIIKNEDDLQKYSNEHEILINNILGEEEDFINNHKLHIDDMVELVKQEMLLINEVDKPGSDIDSYVSSLDKLFQEKIERIASMKSKLTKFHKLLKEEEVLAKRISEFQNEDEAFHNSNDNDDFV